MHGFVWSHWDTAIVMTAAVAAMSCALPGVWLVLRQQSMMGDALSHTALPGVVMSFLAAQWMKHAGWVSAEALAGVEQGMLVAGAIVIGILTALLTEWVRRFGRVESSAALGVVFTSMFAFGILLLRLKADDVHIDPDCVLFGQLELTALNTVQVPGVSMGVPVAFLSNAALLLANLLLLALFFKELRIAAFDPELATAVGIPAGLIHYLLMGVTAATTVLAFESVGSILVVALLIAPAACASLLCDRLSSLIALSLIVAATSALAGHVLAKWLPPLIFGPLGFPQVRDASTSGMIAVACGLFFLAAFLFSPKHGLAGRWAARGALRMRMAADDVLATIYRFEETSGAQPIPVSQVRSETSWIGAWSWRYALWNLSRRGLISGQETLRLTDEGRREGGLLIRSHRLWETYMQKHFNLPDDHLHESAHVVEHFLDQELRTQLAEELESPEVDPHGKSIPDHEG